MKFLTGIFLILTSLSASSNADWKGYFISYLECGKLESVEKFDECLLGKSSSLRPITDIYFDYEIFGETADLSSINIFRDKRKKYYFRSYLKRIEKVLETTDYKIYPKFMDVNFVVISDDSKGNIKPVDLLVTFYFEGDFWKVNEIRVCGKLSCQNRELELFKERWVGDKRTRRD